MTAPEDGDGLQPQSSETQVSSASQGACYGVRSVLASATSKAARRGLKTRLTAAHVDRCLEGCEPLVAVGYSDRALAERSGLLRGQVRAWRRRKGLRGTPGRPRCAKPGGVDRGPRAPELDSELELVTRGPMEYPRFARAVAALFASGWKIQDIAIGVGVSDVDVEVAVSMLRDVAPSTTGSAQG